LEDIIHEKGIIALKEPLFKFKIISVQTFVLQHIDAVHEAAQLPYTYNVHLMALCQEENRGCAIEVSITWS